MIKSHTFVYFPYINSTYIPFIYPFYIPFISYEPAFIYYIIFINICHINKGDIIYQELILSPLPDFYKLCHYPHINDQKKTS